MSSFPAILEWNFRCDIPQPRVKINSAFFLQFEERKGDECLADPAYPKFCVAGDGTIRGQVRMADSAAPKKLPIRNQRRPRSGNMLLVEHFLHSLLQFLERLRVRQIVFLLRGECVG